MKGRETIKLELQRRMVQHIRTDLLGTTDGTAVGIGMLRRDVQDVRLKWV